MASPEFAKCGCRHCGGHIEFPAAGAGRTVPCPHCGRPTVLAASVPVRERRGFRRSWLVAGAAVVLLVAGAAGAFFGGQKTRNLGAGVERPAPQPASNAPIISVPAPVAAAQPQPQVVTNDFAIMPFRLAKTPGSSLIYVVGTVRNTSDRQRFGIKVEFGLFDTNDNVVGSATDYQPVLESHAEWHFKAMVMASKTVAARFRSIGEDK